MNAARIVASGFGTGLLPLAPGTWGSLAAALAGAVLLDRSPWLLAGCAGASVAAGLWAIPRCGGLADPGWVVIDEVAGMWITMIPLGTPSAARLALAFALFRVLDIAKPGPIGMIDRQPGAWSVMGDDIAAGLAGAALLWAVLR